MREGREGGGVVTWVGGKRTDQMPASRIAGRQSPPWRMGREEGGGGGGG